MSTELDTLRKQIEELNEKAETLATKEREAAIIDINQKIHTYHITAGDLDFPGSKKASKVAVKYRLKQNHWTGRGRQPKWIVDHLEKGGKLDDLLIR